MPPRTLQHRLRNEGVTFHRLLDAVRVELAVRYLRGSFLSAAQIGEMLQFGDSSAFCRFLKQQTGRSPRELRREGMATASPREGADRVSTDGPEGSWWSRGESNP